MPKSDDNYLNIDGQRVRVRFTADLTDQDRTRLGYTARGTACACPDCSCTNEAEIGTPDNPSCGCCLADCLDVHPPTV